MADRFQELIDRQLDLFEQEDADFLARVEEAERDYDRADREEAEEIFGRFQELVEFGTEALAEMRDAYAATLDSTAADDYVAEFNAGVLRRLPRFALEIDGLRKARCHAPWLRLRLLLLGTTRSDGGAHRLVDEVQDAHAVREDDGLRPPSQPPRVRKPNPISVRRSAHPPTARSR